MARCEPGRTAPETQSSVAGGRSAGRPPRGGNTSRSMSFGILFVLVLAGLAGPLFAADSRLLVPVIVGELVAGLALGRSGFAWLHPAQPTTAFLADIGFAMLMFTAGMHVPLRTPGLKRQLGKGGMAAGVATVIAVGAGWAAAHLAHVPHAAVYAVVLASGSAAVLVPSLDEFGLLRDRDALAVAAQVALADVASIVAVPIALRPHKALQAGLGVVAVAACAAVLLLALRAFHDAKIVASVRRMSKQRAWALDLRLSLLVLFGLCWLATRTGASILIAGFAIGLVVAAIGGPKRFSRQVTGVAQGFFVPLYFVVLGARIDVRDLVRHSAIVELAVLLVAFNVGLHLIAALLTRQPVAAGLTATVQLGVPAAVSTLGLQEGILTGGEAAALMVAALASIAISELGVALLVRRADATSTGATPGAPSP